MRIWIDLANSPHVPFFRALIPEFTARGHQVEISARDFAQTVELAMKAGLLPHVIGGHGGGKLTVPSSPINRAPPLVSKRLAPS